MTNVGGIAGEQLRSFIQRIERLEEEKKTIADDIREVFAEAKSNGFDPKIMRQVLRLRKMETADRIEQAALLETYLAALGMSEMEEAIDDAGGEPGGIGRGEDKAPAKRKTPAKKKRGGHVKEAADGIRAGKTKKPAAKNRATKRPRSRPGMSENLIETQGAA